MASKKLEVIITGDSKGAQRAMGQAGDSAKKMESKFGKISKSIGSGLMLGLGGAVVGLAAMTPELIDLGGRLESWRIKTDTVFEQSAASVRKWADSNNEVFGLTDEELTGLAASFGDLLKPMGFTSSEAATMAQDVVGLSGALSEWTGGQRTASEVTDILAKAMLGEREGLKELGISISENDVTARLAAKGQDKLTGAALQQAKAIATQELIFEKSADAQKAFAEGGNETIRAGNKLKAIWGEVQIVLAEKLVPILAKAAGWFADMAPKVMEFVQTHQTLAKVVGGVVLAAIGAYVIAMGAAAVSTIAAAWPVLAIIAAVGALAFGLKWAYDNVGWFRDAVDATAQYITQTAVPALKLMWAWFAEKILPILQVIVRFYVTAWTAAAKLYVQYVSFMVRAGMTLWGFFSRNLLPIIRTVAGWVGGQLRQAFNNAQAAIAYLAPRVMSAISALQSFYNSAKPVAAFIAGALVTAFGRSRDAVGWMVDRVSSLVSILQRMVDAARAAADAISKIPSKIPGSGIIGSIAGAIPGFSSGGRPPIGTPYIVGENGPELRIDGGPGVIIPNDQITMPSRRAVSSAAASSRSGGNTYITLRVEGSVLAERELVDVVRSGLIDVGRRTGRPVLAGY